MPEANSNPLPVVYKTIVGYPGYRVGSDGTVWSCWSRRSLGVGKGAQYFLGDRWHIRKQSVNVKSGYLQVMLSANKCKKLFTVHRLVLEAFIGECPQGMECCHEDGIRLNCRLSNLRWDTRSANHEDKRRHGTLHAGDRHYSRHKPELVTRGEKHHAAKITACDVREIRKQSAAGATPSFIAKKFPISQAQVRRIVSYRSWTHVDPIPNM